MVAVVSGTGLGLFTSNGTSGNSNVGRGRDQVFVNTTTGNLVVQSTDDTLAALGLDFAAVRTYNSQGLTDEDNNDQWRLGVQQRIYGLTGTVNTAGSTIKKVFGDGAEVVYTWNTTRSRYESNDGDGANDFLTWNGTVWTWTDGSSRATEEYGTVNGVANTWRIKFSRDADANTVTYTYATGTSLLSSIAMAGGTAQTVNLTYVTGTSDISSIQVVSNGVTTTLTRYYYDSSHRLRQVVVDLTPADNTVPLPDVNADGIYESTANQTYITTYTYESTSKRIASITQTDGSSVSFTYQNVNGDYRLKTVTDAESRVTTFTYNDVLAGGGTPMSTPPITGSYQTTDNVPYSQVPGALTTSPAGWNVAGLRESSTTSINDPRIGFDANGNGWLVWRSASNVIAQRYTRATNSWGPEITLDSSTDTASNQSLSVDASGNAVVAWVQNDANAVSSVWGARYDAATGTWSAATLIDSTVIDPTFGARITGNTLFTAINGSNSVVAWQNSQTAGGTTYDLYVVRLDATTLYPPELVDSYSATATQQSVAIDSLGNVMVAYQQSDGTNTNVYVSRYDRAANSWSGSTVARDNVTSTASDPRIALDANGNGILVYRTSTDVKAVRYTRATNSWSTTQATLDLTANAGAPTLPVLALDANGTGFAAWVQSDGTAASVYAARFDGTNWGTATLLDTGAGIDSTLPANSGANTMQISVSGNRAAVMWMHNQTATGSVFDAYVARYNGTAWQAAESVEQRPDNAAQVNVAIDSLGNVSAAFMQNDGTANSAWVSRYNVSAASSYYVVPASATWQTIANTVYGVNSAAAGTQLQSQMSGQTLATGVQLGGFPTTLTLTQTVSPYYVIVSGDTWAIVAQKLYGTTDANAITALQTFNGGSTTLPALGQRLNVANPLSYTTGGSGAAIYQRTTVQDALGLVTTYLKDAQGRLISVQTPAVGGSSLETRYTYDPATGNIATIAEDPNGLNRVTTFTYDAVTGLLLSTRDSLGNTVTRTYNANNQLDTETSYLVRDPDGAGAGQPSSPLVSRYIYDSENHLRFAITADGRVTEHIYDAPGQRTTTFKYASSTYTTATYTEAALNTWATNSARRGGPLERTDYTYDFRGNVDTVKMWAATDSAGAGTGAVSTTRFVYDQRGNLLSTVEARGEATATPATDYVTSYTYDGFGRLLTTTSWVSSTETARLVQTNSYDDANRRTVSTFANGLTKTLNYDKAGSLTSVVNGPTALGTTSYTYDADARLRVTTDATGVKSYAFYDDAGRLLGTVDGDGSLVEFIYNRASQVVKTVRYATALASATLTSLSGGTWSSVAFATLRTEANPAGTQARNQITRNVYDASGTLVYTVDQLGAVTQQVYDGAGRLTDQVSFFNTQAIAASVDEVLPSAITVTSNAADRRARYFYNGDGQLLGTLDGAGYLKENTYDAAGRLTATVGYYTVTNSANWLTGTLATLRPALDAARDITTRIFYDAQGRQIGVLDGENYLTETVYDVAGHVLQSIRYDRVLTYTAGTSTFSTLKTAATGATTHTTTYTYDGLGQVLTETNFEATQTLYTYDVAGNVVSMSSANGVSAEVRTTQTRYDVLGRITQELTGEGSVALAALGGSPTQTQIDDVWSKYGVKYTYDNAGRRTSATVRPNDAQTNTTYFYYDDDGRLRFELDARGAVTENRYNALGQLTDRLVYWRTVSVASPQGGLLSATPGLINTLTQTESANVHEKTTYTYSLRGELLSTSTAANATTAMTYNVFGEIASRNAGSGFTAYDYTYDARGLQKLTKRGATTFEDRTYDAFGRLASVIDARGNTSTMTFDRLGREITSSQPGDANARVTSYDGFSRVLTVRDKLLNTTTYAYNDTTRTVTVTTPESIVVTTVHNRHGDTLTVTANGNTTSYAYDPNGLLTSASDGLGSLEGRSYDRSGRQLTATDARGIVTTFSYDASNRMLTRTVDTGTGGLALQTTYVYDTQSRVMTVTEPGNKVTRTEYDRDGRVSAIVVDPAGTTPSRTEYVYDAANNTTLITEGVGSTVARRTLYVFDALGRRTDEYVDPASLGGALNIRTQYRYDNNNNVTRRIDAKNNSIWYVYDAQNRLIQAIDALGGVTQTTYDSEDRIVTMRQFYTPVSTASLGDAPALQSVTTNLNDHVTRTVYDRDGREKYSLQTSSATGAPGSVTETAVVTERTFDSGGNVTRTRIYRNAVTVPATVTTANVSTALTNAGNDVANLHANDRVEWTAYDVRGRAIFHVDGTGAVVQSTFDASGNVIAAVAYAQRVALSNLMTTASLTTWATGSSIANDANNRVTRSWFDTLDRERFTLDAEGYLVETKYLDAAKQQQTIVYAGKPTIASGATLAQVVTAAAAAPNQSSNQTTTQTFDVMGHVVQVTDPNGKSEYMVFDAVGNKIKYVNKKAASPTDAAYTWTFEYDADHRLVYQRTPNVSVASVDASTLAVSEATQSIVTHNFYDALGNVISRTEAEGTLQARTISYEYDLLGRVTATVSPLVGIYEATTGDSDLGNGAAVQKRETSANIRSETAYDVFGNAFRNRLVTSTQASDSTKGSYTYKAFDNLGRITYEIDAKDQITQNGYNAFGDKVLVTRFALPLTGSLPRTGTGITTAQVAALLPTNTTQNRAVTTVFDRLGREISVSQPSVRSFAPTANAPGGGYYDSAPSTEFVYNAFGDVLRKSVQINTVDWQHTYSYYDHRGLKLAELDPSRYLTQYEYDETGDLTRQVEYARPTTGTLDYTTYGTVVSTTRAGYAPGTPESFNGYDRETTFTYDKLNHKLTETKRQLEYASIDSGTLNPHFDGIQTTTFGYDALGNQTLMRVVNPATGANMDSWTYYDVLGRVIAVAAPLRDRGDGVSVTPLTRMLRDAAGNLVQQIDYLNGTTAIPADGSLALATPASANATLDRATTMVVDAQNHVVRSRDATGADRFASYNVRGDVAKEWTPVANAISGTNETIVKIYRYDGLGQQTELVETQRYNGLSTDKVTRYSEYNAFGEIIAKYNDTTIDIEKTYYDYDAAGRVWRTNADDGVDKVYMYDLAGNATLELRSRTVNLNAGRTNGPTGVQGTYTSAQNVLNTVVATDLMRTETVYDAKGNVLQRRMPTFDIDTRFPPVASSIQLGTINGATYVNWAGTVNSQIGQTFSYRVAGSNNAWTAVTIETLSGTTIGANVNSLYGQPYEFYIGYYRFGEIMPFAESIGTFRFDRATLTTATISQNAVDPASQVATLNSSFTGGMISWTAPADATVTATMKFNGGTAIAATRSGGTFTVDARSALATNGTYSYDIEYFRGGALIAKKSGSLTASGTNVTRNVVTGSNTNQTAAPYNVQIATPSGSGTGSSRTISWAVNASTSEGPMTAEYQYRKLADPSYSAAVTLNASGGVFSVNVGSLAQGNYEYIIQYKIGGRFVAYQHSFFNTVDAVNSSTVSTGVINGGGPPPTPAISTIAGTGGGNSVTFDPDLVGSEYAYGVDDDGTFFTRFYTGGANTVRPVWTGSQNSAWVIVDYMTIGGTIDGLYRSTYSNSVAATYQGTMTRNADNTFWAQSYTGNAGEYGPYGVDHITRIRVYTAQNGTLIADTSNPVATGRGITWAAPSDDTNITATVYYETTTNNWTLVGTATRGGNVFSMGVDAVPDGTRRIKVEYRHPGESWAFNTAIATITQAPNVAPVLSAQSSSNHDPAWLMPINDSLASGTIGWSSPVPAGGTARLEYWNGSGWSLWQQWTSGTDLSYDFTPIATTTSTVYQFRIVYRAAEGWMTQYAGGTVTVQKNVVNDPPKLYVDTSSVYNSTSPAIVIAPAGNGAGLTWTQAKLNSSDTVSITYSRNGDTNYKTDFLAGSGPTFTTQFPQLADQSSLPIYWSIEYKRVGEINSYARANGFIQATITTTTTYSTVNITSQAAAYPSTVQQVSLPTYRQSDRAILFSTAANALSDIQFLLDGVAQTVTTDGSGYKVILPVGTSAGAHTYSIKYQGSGNPYASTSGSITVTNTVAGSTNEVITVNAARDEKSMSIAPGIGSALIVDPPYAVYHQEWSQVVDPNTGQVTGGYVLKYGAMPWGPENTSNSGGWYYTTFPSAADPDGSYSQVPQANYTYGLHIAVTWPSPGTVGIDSYFEYWLLSNPSNVMRASVSRPNGGYAADIETVPAGNYGYRIAFTHTGAFAPFGMTEGTFTRGTTNTITVSASPTPAPVAVTPTSSQKYDRWGNVIETTDAAGNVTSYRYDARNSIVQTLEALDYVIDKRDATPLASINGTLERVEKTNSYDLLGRLVETQDGYDQANRVTYNNAGQQITKRNADWARYTSGATSSNVYDIFGNLIQSIDEIGYYTRYKYDKAGRVTEIWREIDLSGFTNHADPTSTANVAGSVQKVSYTYDQNGRRVTETNGATETTKYSFDFLGNIVKRRTPSGYDTTYVYNADSKKTSETDAVGSVKTWIYDAFGRVTTHNELSNANSYVGSGIAGGNLVTNVYNYAGQMTLVTSAAGENVTYNYDRGGNLTSIVDAGVNRVTTYRYDAAGRQIRESVVVNDLLHQDSRYKYDAHNRITSIDDTDYREKIVFDVNGNRGYMEAKYADHNQRIVSETLAYKYDEMNRLTQSAINPGGDLAVTQFTDLTYNGRGDRVLQVAPGRRWSVASGTNKWSDTIQGFYAYVDDKYTYDGLGRLKTDERNLYHTTTGGQNPTNILLHSYTYDLANRRISEFNRSMESGTSVDRTTTTGYDTDGRANTQLTKKLNSSLVYVNESLVTYGSSTWNGSAWTTGFDSANNLRQYTVQSYSAGGNPTILYTYKTTYMLGEGYLETAQDVSSTGTGHPLPGHTDRTYNVNRELVKFKDADSTKVDQTRYFTNNQQGQVLTTIMGNFEANTAAAWRGALERGQVGGQYNGAKAQYYFFVQGNLTGSFGQIQDQGQYSPRFDVNATPVSDSYPTATPPVIVVAAGDNLRTVAARVFGDASLWYVLAEENGLTDPEAPIAEGTQLRVPNNVFTLTNTSDSFKPFNINDALGDTTPSQPAPPAPKGCGVIGMIIMIVVMVVVTIFTAGAAAALMGTAFSGGLSGLMALGATTLGSMSFGMGLVVGAVSSAISQGVGIALGIQDKFDWKQVAASALSSGIGSFMPAGGVVNFGASTGAKFASQVVNGAISNTVSQGVNMAVGLQKKFDWRGVVASAIEAPVADYIGDKFAGARFSSKGPGSIGHILSHAALGAGVAAIRGQDIGAGAIGGATEAFLSGALPITESGPIRNAVRKAGTEIVAAAIATAAGRDASVAANAAGNAFDNNYLMHKEIVERADAVKILKVDPTNVAANATVARLDATSKARDDALADAYLKRDMVTFNRLSKELTDAANEIMNAQNPYWKLKPGGFDGDRYDVYESAARATISAASIYNWRSTHGIAGLSDDDLRSDVNVARGISNPDSWLTLHRWTYQRPDWDRVTGLYQRYQRDLIAGMTTFAVSSNSFLGAAVVGGLQLGGADTKTQAFWGGLAWNVEMAGVAAGSALSARSEMGEIKGTPLRRAVAEEWTMSEAYPKARPASGNPHSPDFVGPADPNLLAAEQVKNVTAPIDFNHILDGQVYIDKHGNLRATGGHSLVSGNVEVVPGTETPADAHGVYEASVLIRDPATGQFVLKTNTPNGISTLVPKNWTNERTMVEMDAAFNAKQMIGTNRWQGISPTGVTFRGYLNPDGTATAYPVKK